MDKKTHYAGFIIRVMADFIDSCFLDLITCLVGVMILGGVFWLRKLGALPSLPVDLSFFDAFNSFWLQVALVVVRLILSLIYYTGATYKYGTTLGKRPFRIYVVTYQDLTPLTLKQSFIRCLAYAVSYLPFGTGFLMIAFQPEKRGLHDLIAGTVSIKSQKIPA